IAEDIYECTNSHKGLVGACCMVIKTEVIELGTFKSIVHVIKNLSLKQIDIISIVLCHRTYTYECNNKDGKIYQLLAEGIIVFKSINEDFIEIEFSSPILQ
ncbi:21436_t:CDS:2, partial [Dentiscutata erythropus]